MNIAERVPKIIFASPVLALIQAQKASAPVWLTLSAGYLGSSLWGGLMFSAARAKRVKAEWVTGFIGVLVIALTLLYVRTLFGLGFGVLFGGALFTVAKQASRTLNRTLLLALGMTSVLYAILDIKSDIIDRPGAESDAYMLSEITGIPTVAWGALWIAAALGFSFWLLRQAYKEA